MAELTQKQLVLQRLGILKSERASWFAHWQELTLYILPRNGRYFVQDRNRGQRRHNNIYDSTATVANRTLAAGLMGGLTSPARPWFRMSTPDTDLAKRADVKEWLSLLTTIVLDIFAKSNTYRALHTHYQELGCFGTSASVFGRSFKNVIHHYPVTAGEYALAQNWQGEVTTLYREFDKTVGEIVKEFGIGNVSNNVKALWDRGQLDKWITIVHAIEPRSDRDMRKRDAKNMPWKSVYYERGGEPDKTLRESGYKKFPGLCPRWDVAGGDIYGNSPGMEALGDVKQLQHQQLRKAQGIDYQTNPPLQIPSALKGKEMDRLPGGNTYYDGAGGPGGKISSMFDVALNLDHLRLDIEDVRTRIRSAFYADLFLMLQNDSQDVRKTATEVAELHEEKMLMLGPVLERLHNELLQPLIDNTIETIFEAGLMPPPPDDLRGQDLNVELTSILALAQRAVATNSIDRFVANLGQIAQFKPEVLDKFDQDEWADYYSDVLGVDPQLVVAADKVAMIRKQRAQQQAQAQQVAQAEQMASAGQKAAQIPTQGGSSNAANDIIGNLTGYGT